MTESPQANYRLRNFCSMELCLTHGRSRNAASHSTVQRVSIDCAAMLRVARRTRGERHD